MLRSESDAGGATWRSPDSDGGSTDFVAKDIKRFRATRSVVLSSTSTGTSATTCGLRAGTSLLLIFLVLLFGIGHSRSWLSLCWLSLPVLSIILTVVVASK